MSRNNKKNKETLVNGSELEKNLGNAQTRKKKTRVNDKSSPAKTVKQRKSNDSVKRKINFNESEGQDNNNSNVEKKQSEGAKEPEQDDGIQILADNFDMTDVEELDYEDDLSVAGDEDVPEVTHVESIVEELRPGTSSQTLSQLANEEDEEKLMTNPVIQKMMLKFFKEQMKDLSNNDKEAVRIDQHPEDRRPGIDISAGDGQEQS